MKKSFVVLTFILIALGSLFATPGTYEIIPIKDTPSISIAAMAIDNTVLYYYDQKEGVLYLDDLSIKDTNQAKKSISLLPPKTKIVDICVNDGKLYLLNADQKSILIYQLGTDVKATRLASINLQGSKELSFKKLKQIEVNYLGYIYLLDESGVYAFSQEGMLMNRQLLLKPISMSLGEDQILRVLEVDKQNYQIKLYNHNLSKETTEPSLRKKPTEINILGLAVNRWGELQLLNSDKSYYINKYSGSGKLIPNTQAGVKGSRREVLSFQNPISIKCGQKDNYSIIAVLDTKNNGIHLFIDEDRPDTADLKRPPYGERIALQATNTKAVDYYYGDGASFILQQANPTTKQIKRMGIAIDAYTLRLQDYKAHDIQDFNAIDGYGDELYVLDSKACKVHVFNAQTGDYINSFGQKGRQQDALQKAESMVVDAEGMIYVADSEQKKIAKFKKDATYRGKNPYQYIDNINLERLTVKPQLLREYGEYLYCLFSDGSILRIEKSTKKQTTLDLGKVKASTFDFIYGGNLAVIEQITKTMYIYTNPGFGRKAHYLSTNRSASFPHFADIKNLRYDSVNNRLVIIDPLAEGMRYLYFYTKMSPPLPGMSLDKDGIVTLKWEPAQGIKSWIVTKIYDSESISKAVSTPIYQCEPFSSIPYSYTIRAVAVDDKQSEDSPPLTDYYSYARHLANNKEYRQAIQYFGRAEIILEDKRVKDEITECYLELADAAISRRDYLQAHKTIDEALQTMPLAKLIAKKCSIYNVEGEYQQVLNYLANVTPSYLESMDLSYIYIESAYHAQNHHEVLRVIRLYREKYPDKPELSEYELEAYKELGNKTEALRVYQKIRQQRPGLDTELEFVQYNLTIQEYYSAQSSLEALLKSYAGQQTAQINYLLGRARLGLQEYSRAEEYFNAAIKAAPKHPDYYYYRALAYDKLMMPQESTLDLQKAHEYAPYSVEYGCAFANNLNDNNRKEAALRVLKAISEYVEENDAAADYHYLYARILFDEKQYTEAKAEILKATRYRSGDTIIDNLQIDIDTAINRSMENLPPLQLIDLKLDKIYPALDRYYQEKPIGTVVLRNNRNVSLDNIKISVRIAGVGTERLFSELTIAPNSQKQIYIYANFTNDIFYLSGNKEINILARYEYMGKEERYQWPPTYINILPLGAMDWSKRSALACFVTPQERYLSDFVRNTIMRAYDTVSKLENVKNKNILNAMKIYSFFSTHGFQYISDSNTRFSDLDMVQYPTETITNKSGDCEDFLVLLAASMESIGIHTALIDLPRVKENSGHVMLAIDSEMTANEIHENRYEISDFIEYNNSYWLPLETTLMGKAGFIRAWLEAKKAFDEYQNSGNTPFLQSFNDAQSIYPPSSFSRDYQGWGDGSVNRNEAQKNYNAEVIKLNDMRLENRRAQSARTLEKYPNSITYRLRYADELRKSGQKDEAEVQYLQVLSIEPNNYTANMHLGNICAERSRLEDARYYYNKALNRANSEQKDIIYTNLCIMEYKNNNYQAANQNFSKIGDKSVLQKQNRSIYINLMGN